MRELKTSRKRTEKDREKLTGTVKAIIEDVIKNGDEALFGYNSRFDGCERKSLAISADEIAAAYREVPETEVEDIRKAAAKESPAPSVSTASTRWGGWV